MYKVLVGKAQACIKSAKKRKLEAVKEEKFVKILFWIVYLYRLRCRYSGIKIESRRLDFLEAVEIAALFHYLYS